jgi:hypothetical protein
MRLGPHPIDRKAVFDELRWLADRALAAGAPRNRVLAVVESIIDLILDQADPRSVRAIELAGRVAAARATGVGVPDLANRFGKSQSQIYRLLRLSRTTSCDKSPVERLQRSQESTS